MASLDGLPVARGLDRAVPERSASTHVARAPRFVALRRWARDTAVAVLLIMALPLLLVTTITRQSIEALDWPEAWLERYEQQRLLLPTADPAITPTAAGMALARALPASERPDIYTSRDIGAAAERIREIVPPDSAAFPTQRRRGTGAFPDPVGLLSIASGPLTAAEQTWLATMAALPIWRDLDVVAHARATDVLGGRRSQLPGTLSFVLERAPRTETVVRIAEAGVARAAWHVSRGDYVKAEAALRTVVAFGYALMDHGVDWSEFYRGRAALKIGLNGLSQLGALVNDDALRGLGESPEILFGPEQNYWIRYNEQPDRFLALLSDPRVPRAIRMDRLAMANALLPCASVRSVVFGMAPALTRRLASIRDELARSPLEQELLLTSDRPVPLSEWNGWALWKEDHLGAVVVGAGAFASTVTGNPRFAQCALRAVR